MVGIFSALCKEKLCKKRLTLCRIDDIIRSQKRKSFERGESNGNRRNILQAYEARQDAVTETIKVIAIKKERGFQTTRTNRLKSAIGF